MISQLFFLSTRGDTIINRDFRNDLVKNTPEIFFRYIKLYKGDAPPLFNIDGINFSYVKKSSLYIVCTSRFNVSPAFMTEILNKIGNIIKDFCGVLNEEAIRKNFILVYEIIDEAIDLGYPQLTSTELVKPMIVNEPIMQQNVSKLSTFSTGRIFQSNTISSTATQRSVQDKNKKNEIFVDIFEKISILFNSSGYVINSSIEGYIQMKSFLTGNPPLKMALNDDLIIGKHNAGTSISAVVFDDCNFHESVNTSQFDMNRTLTINPPDGEFTAMNYRVTGDFQAPFRLYPFVDDSNPYCLELTIKLKACYPKQSTSSYVLLKFNVPKSTQNVHNTLETKDVQGQTIDYNETQRVVQWQIQKLKGDTELQFRCKIVLQSGNNSQTARKEIGPMSLNFEIPMYNVSNICIKYLKIEGKDKDKNYNPYRWVRYITQSSSYVCRT